MNIQEQNFLILLKGITNEIRDRDYNNVILYEPEWNSILQIAERSNLLALLYQFITTHNLCSDEGVIKEYYAKAASQVMTQMSSSYEFLQLYKLFNEKNCPPIVMKGIICRQLYKTHANERLSGDEDILIRIKDFPEIDKILETQGYKKKNETLSDKQLHELQEVDYFGNGLHIEVHTNALGKENTFRRKLNSYINIDKIYSNAIQMDIEDEVAGKISVLTMSPTDHLVFLILHAWKHFALYGFGIRQILDILLYYDINKIYIDEDELQKILLSSETLLFFNDLLFIGNEYLDFENFFLGNYDNKYNSRIDKLLNDVFESGCFGNESTAKITAGNYTGEAINRGRIRPNIIRAIFPSKNKIAVQFPTVIDKPYLLPIYWLIRIFRFIRHNKKNGGTLVQDSLAISRKRLELLREYGIVK